MFILVGCHFTYSTIESGKAVKGYSACHAALCDSHLSLILHLGHKVTALSCLAFYKEDFYKEDLYKEDFKLYIFIKD